MNTHVKNFLTPWEVMMGIPSDLKKININR